MKTDIILSGVGGQGILSIAAIVGRAAMAKDLYIKQAEVHGMSQRGGDVHSNLRISDKPIYSDLISRGEADVIISLEPMEALRYVPYLSADGWVVTSSSPFINIPNYPDVASVVDELGKLPHVVMLDIAEIAAKQNMTKCANILLLGAAVRALHLLSYEELEESIRDVFASKGSSVVDLNLQALSTGFHLSDQKNK